MNKVYLLLLLQLILLSCSTSQYCFLSSNGVYLYENKVVEWDNSRVIIVLKLNLDRTFNISEYNTTPHGGYDGVWKYIDHNKILLTCNEMTILFTNEIFPVPQYTIAIQKDGNIRLWRNNSDNYVTLTKKE